MSTKEENIEGSKLLLEGFELYKNGSVKKGCELCRDAYVAQDIPMFALSVYLMISSFEKKGNDKKAGEFIKYLVESFSDQFYSGIVELGKQYETTHKDNKTALNIYKTIENYISGGFSGWILEVFAGKKYGEDIRKKIKNVEKKLKSQPRRKRKSNPSDEAPKNKR